MPRTFVASFVDKVYDKARDKDWAFGAARLAVIRGRYASALALLFLALAASAWALPAPEWRYTAFPVRMVFTLPPESGASVLVRLPRTGEIAATGGVFLATAPDGSVLPVRVVHADAGEIVLQCALPDAAPRRPYAVYGGKPSAEPPAASPEAAPDPAPVAGDVLSVAGKGVPTSWERLSHLLWASPADRSKSLVTPETQVLRHHIRSLQGGDQLLRSVESGKEHHRSGLRALMLRSFVLCPDPGSYRLAVDCADAGFVSVDGAVAAAWPGEHPPGEWRLGPPLSLKAGVHRIEILNVSDTHDTCLRVGWLLPGRRDVEPIGDGSLVSSCEGTDLREERLGRAIQAGFSATPMRAYSFRGVAAVFTQVQFKNTTQDWLASDVSSRWTFGDGSQGEGDAPSHIYPAAKMYETSLEVRDRLGFVSRGSRSVDCRPVEPVEFAVAGDLVGLPAVCYGRDRLAPYLRIKGAAPEGAAPAVALDATWEVTRRSGATDGQALQVPLPATPVLLALRHETAADLSSLRWRVSHAGVPLAGGTVRFLNPPYGSLPARVEADRLYDKQGDQLVLVAREEAGAFCQPRLPAGRRMGRLVCVDDTLADAGLLEAGSGETYDVILSRLMSGVCRGVKYAGLPAWEQFPQSCGPLRKLVDAPAALRAPADVAVLSIGLRDMLERRDVEAFERETAALTDLLAVSLKIPVVWVTPPRYPADPERSRPYAAAIRRVAEARGIPVADLFTAFRCAQDDWHAFFQKNPLELSDAGQRLAGQQIARTIVGE